MKERIRQIMESLHMTQQVFADYIGIGAATLSSIFNGRTRPTIATIEAIKKKIPNINTDWLVFGIGEMYVSESKTPAEADTQPESTAPTYPQPENLMLEFDSLAAPTPQNAPQTGQNYNSVKSTRPEIVREEVKIVDRPQRRVIEIRVFYDDQTWDTFVPAKK